MVYRYLFLYTIYGPRRINPIAVMRQKIDIPNFNGTNFSGIDTLMSLPCCQGRSYSKQGSDCFLVDGMYDLEFVGKPEVVGAGVFPSLALEGNRVTVTYNASVSFPDPTGGVLISERVDGQWSKGVQISTAGVWAGASVGKSINGMIHVLYIENSVSGPLLIHAWRDVLGTWEYGLVDDYYIPFLPKGLAFGGRTSPAIQSVGSKIYFLWRSGSESSPIILKSFDSETEQMGAPDVLDTLEDAVFSFAPSFLAAQPQTGRMDLLWAKDDAAVLEHGFGLP